MPDAIIANVHDALPSQDDKEDDCIHLIMVERRCEDDAIVQPVRRYWLSLAIAMTVLLVVVVTVVLQRKKYANHSSLTALLAEDTCLQGLFHDATAVSSWHELVYQTATRTDRCSRFLPPRTNCTCASHFLPTPHDALNGWYVAQRRNLDLVANTKKNGTTIFDVALLGDSMTEHWLGTDLGRPNENFAGNYRVYQGLFASLSSIVLGIGGDRVPHLLFRLLHGELVPAKVYWLLIGINDHLGDKCSVDMIVAGNVHIVQTLRAYAPQSTIVINSLLPFQDTPLNQGRDWELVQEINAKLSCYADMEPNVEFFNATSLFVDDTDPQLRVHMDLLSIDKFHPGEEGSRVWGEAIVKRVQELITT